MSFFWGPILAPLILFLALVLWIIPYFIIWEKFSWNKLLSWSWTYLTIPVALMLLIGGIMFGYFGYKNQIQTENDLRFMRRATDFCMFSSCHCVATFKKTGNPWLIDCKNITNQSREAAIKDGAITWQVCEVGDRDCHDINMSVKI